MPAMNHHRTDLSMPGTMKIELSLVALAQAAAFKGDDSRPRHPRRRNLRYLPARFRHLLSDTEQILAPRHFAPHILRPHARRCPQHRQVIEQIGALTDPRV